MTTLDTVLREYDALKQEDYAYEEYREQCLVDEKRPLSIEEWRAAAGDWWKLR